MYFITICDDSQNEIDQILLLLEDFFPKKTMISIQTFNSSTNLLKSIESGNISDIYLLDVIMPELSGIDIGKVIKDKKEDACIIYFTNSKEFALNAFELYALQYLIKPVKKTALHNALNKAIDLIDNKDKVFLVETKDGQVSLKHKDIIYIEYMNHVMIFYTINKVIVSKHIRVSFNSALSSLLLDSSFVQTHRAYIINLKHVKKMKKRLFIMSKAYEIPISKNYLETSINQYLNYMFGEDYPNA